MTRPLLLLLASLGCRTPNPVDTAAEPPLTDELLVSAELCNGRDDDGDGHVDEGLTLGEYYVDADGDGHGTGDPQDACGPLDGLAASDGDCHDADPTVHPGATELCDEADQDCDDAIDEDVEQLPWTVDADGDGYGTEVWDCAMPDHLADTGGDCDDADPSVHPGAEEICDDGIDQDCSGLGCFTDLEGDISLMDADAIILADDDSGALGYRLFTVDGVGGELDGIDDLIVSWTGEEVLGAYAFRGPLSGTITPLADAATSWLGSRESTFIVYDVKPEDETTLLLANHYDEKGFEQVVVYDGLDGGGIGDGNLVISETDGSEGYTTGGDLFGDFSGDGVTDPSFPQGDRYLLFDGSESGSIDMKDYLFSIVETSSGTPEYAASADVDGDGYLDLAIGYRTAESFGTTRVVLYSGPVGSSGFQQELATIDYNDPSGNTTHLRPAFIDLMGVQYLVLGAPLGSNSSMDLDEGRAMLLDSVLLNGDYDLPDDSDLLVAGTEPGGYGIIRNELFGSYVSGYPEIYWTTPRATTGAVHLLPMSLFAHSSEVLDTSAHATFLGEQSGDGAGWMVAGGEFSGDSSVSDLAVSATSARGAGAVYLIWGEEHL